MHPVLSLPYGKLKNMTPDEKRRQKADLLLECEEAEEDIRHITEKVRGQVELIETVKDALGSYVGEGRYVSDRDDLLDKILTDARYRSAMKLDEVLATIKEFKTAQEKLKDLRSRREALRS